jgi:hypothetical protein
MAYTVDVDLNRGEIYALLQDRARRIGNRVANVARRRSPKATGKLAASIMTVAASAPGFVFADIGTPLNYGIWVHEGTGIYGRGHPIRPTRASVMRFRPGRSIGPIRPQGHFHRGRQRSGFVYAKSVRGQVGSPFLTSALSDVVGSSGRIRHFGRSRRG